MPYGQLVIGPGGSGKTSYVLALASYLMKTKHRNTVVVNLDPANEMNISFERVDGDAVIRPHIDIQDLIQTRDVMAEFQVGPNGALMYCMEFLVANISWLQDKIDVLMAQNDKTYFLFDLPGQIELYNSHSVMTQLVAILEKSNFRLTTIFVIDSTYLSDAGSFISLVLSALSAMMTLPLPHINVLSKIDLFKGRNSPFGLEYYAEVMDLTYLIDHLPQSPFFERYKKLNEALIGLLTDYSYVTFVPLSIKRERTLRAVLRQADRANGFLL